MSDQYISELWRQIRKEATTRSKLEPDLWVMVLEGLVDLEKRVREIEQHLST